MTTDPGGEPFEDVGQVEESEATGPAARAAELRAEFRDVHGLDCGDEVVEEGGGAMAGCGVESGIVMFLVPPESESPEAVASDLMNGEEPWITCVGADFVAAAPNAEAAELVYSAELGCNFS